MTEDSIFTMKIDCVADVSGGHWTENGNSKSGRNIMSSGYAYILCNDRKNVLYTGSTLDLKKRVNHHKNGCVAGFTKRYNVYNLIYFEEHVSIDAAVMREKQIKGYTRVKKIAFINSKNPNWDDLYIYM